MTDHSSNGNGTGNGTAGIGGNGSAHRPATFVRDVVERTNAAVAGRMRQGGAAPNSGQFPLPQILTFQGLLTTIARVYRPSDEALTNSLDNARFMRNDVGIMECLEARQRATSLLNWHLEPEDERSQDQRALCEELTKIVSRMKRFVDYRFNLLHALWYGRYAVQHQYRWVPVAGKMRVMPAPDPVRRGNYGWMPINGDKLVFRHDDPRFESHQYAGQVGIRVAPHYRLGDRIDDRKVELTDRGMAYFLDPDERNLVAIHKHMIEDGAYESAVDAGLVNGVGIRSRIYWDWFQKQEALAFLMEYLERSAGGIELWYYDEGNPNAKEKTEQAALNRLGGQRNVILVPRPRGEDAMAYGVEVIEPGMAGIESLKDLLTNYFGHRIKRYILGQVLSSEAEATGLGSGVAELHLDTFLQIIRYDARNLEETVTDELIEPLKAFNFPAARGIQVRFKIETETPETEKKMEGWRAAWEMGCRLKEQDVMELIGAEMPGPADRALQHPQFTQQPGMGGPGMGQPGNDGASLYTGPGAAGLKRPGGDGEPPATRESAATEIAETAMRGMYGADELEDGQTVAYVNEGGEWTEREVPSVEHDSGERERACRTGPVRRYEFREADHPREPKGGPEGGQFASSESAGSAGEGGGGEPPKGPSSGRKEYRVEFSDETIKHEGVRFSYGDTDQVEALMTPEEKEEFKRWMADRRESYINDEMDSYDPDDDLDWTQFEGDEFLGEDGYIDESLPEIQDALEALRKQHRDEIESRYDESEDYASYLKGFYDEHEDEPRFKGGVAKLDTWGRDEDGDHFLAFDTSGDRRYEVYVWEQSRNASQVVGQPVAELAFADEDGSFEITGAGNAREVFSRVTAASVAFVRARKPPAIYFSAAEGSRQKLYDRMVKSMATELEADGYVAAACTLPSGKRAYLVGTPEKVRDITSRATALGGGVTPLVGSYSRWRSGPPQWEPVEPESNPDWFESDEEWRDFDPVDPPPDEGGDGDGERPVAERERYSSAVSVADLVASRINAACSLRQRYARVTDAINERCRRSFRVSRYDHHLSPEDASARIAEGPSGSPKSRKGGKGGSWVRLGGGAPAFVGPDGTIKKGCPGLKGENVDELIDEDEESRDRRAAKQAHHEARNVQGHQVTATEAKKWEGQGARRQHDAAKRAGKRLGVATKDVLATLEAAHALRLEEWNRTETARAEARRLTGMHAGGLARVENAYRDYSTVPGFDTAAASFAIENPQMGFGRSGDTAAEVWEFIREGAQPKPSIHDDETAEMAAEMVRNRGSWKREAAAGVAAGEADAGDWQRDAGSWGDESGDASFDFGGQEVRHPSPSPARKKRKEFVYDKSIIGVEIVSPSKLSHSEKQDGWLDDDNVKGMVQAIKAGKLLDPVVAIRSTGEVIDGNHRLAAASKAKVDVPVMFITRDEYDEMKADGYGDDEFTDTLIARRRPSIDGTSGGDASFDPDRFSRACRAIRCGVEAAVERYAGKKKAKPAEGQRSLWGDEDEAKHPRAEDGKWTSGAGGGGTEKTDEPEPTATSPAKAAEIAKKWTSEGKPEPKEPDPDSFPTAAKPAAMEPAKPAPAKPATPPRGAFGTHLVTGVVNVPLDESRQALIRDVHASRHNMERLSQLLGSPQKAEGFRRRMAGGAKLPDAVMDVMGWTREAEEASRAATPSPATEPAKPSAPSSSAPKPTVPGQQSSLFGGDDIRTGQQSLFNVVRPEKGRRKPAGAAADITAGLDAKVREKLKEKETLSPADLSLRLQEESLEGQRDLFERTRGDLTREIYQRIGRHSVQTS